MTCLKLLLFAAAAALGHGAAPGVAAAKCKEPPVALLWSYPADGDKDVPTNAVAWLVETNARGRKLSLDGVELASTKLGELMPQHDYTLRVDYPKPEFIDEPARSFEIKFRTGQGPASPPGQVQVHGVEQSASIDDSRCPDVVRAGSCFDTGPRVLLQYAVDEPGVVGYVVDGKPWPVRCDKPAVFVHSSSPKDRCTTIAAIGPGGLVGPATEVCKPAEPSLVDASTADAAATEAATTDAAATDVPNGDSGSCNASSRARGGWGSALLLSTAALSLTRRRRRSS